MRHGQNARQRYFGWDFSCCCCCCCCCFWLAFGLPNRGLEYRAKSTPAMKFFVHVIVHVSGPVLPLPFVVALLLLPSRSLLWATGNWSHPWRVQSGFVTVLLWATLLGEWGDIVGNWSSSCLLAFGIFNFMFVLLLLPLLPLMLLLLLLLLGFCEAR